MIGRENPAPLPSRPVAHAALSAALLLSVDTGSLATTASQPPRCYVRTKAARPRSAAIRADTKAGGWPALHQRRAPRHKRASSDCWPPASAASKAALRPPLELTPPLSPTRIWSSRCRSCCPPGRSRTQIAGAMTLDATGRSWNEK
jgi:hypothetical protein